MQSARCFLCEPLKYWACSTGRKFNGSGPARLPIRLTAYHWNRNMRWSCSLSPCIRQSISTLWNCIYAYCYTIVLGRENLPAVFAEKKPEINLGLYSLLTASMVSTFPMLMKLAGKIGNYLWSSVRYKTGGWLELSNRKALLSYQTQKIWNQMIA